MSRSAVEVREVVKRFGDNVVVNGVSLDNLAGEFITMLGPSSSGKATLLRMITGSIFLQCEDVTGRDTFSASST